MDGTVPTDAEIQAMIEAIPDDPYKIIPDQHLKPIADALEQKANMAEEGSMEEMENTEEIAPAEGAPETPDGEEGGSAPEITDEQRAKIAQLANIGPESVDQLVTEAMKMMESQGQEPSVDALIALLEGDEGMANNMAPSMGVEKPTGNRVF